MLKEVVRGQERASVVLIEDSLAQSGFPVLKAFLVSLQKKINTTHLFLYEESTHILDGLNGDVKMHVKCHDIASDPLGWHNHSSPTMDTDIIEYMKKCLPSGDTGEKCAVVFDCASSLILHRSVTYVCQVLHRLSRESSVEQVICLVHSELHSSGGLMLLHHTCDTVLTLSPPSTNVFHGTCASLHIRPSGKVTKLREHYTISSDYSTIENEEVLCITEAVTQDPSAQVDPAANLTFNLTLTDKEKDARSHLVLPYIKQQKDTTTQSSAGEAKIFYQPDDADDFDEEDPDDDLDI